MYREIDEPALLVVAAIIERAQADVDGRHGGKVSRVCPLQHSARRCAREFLTELKSFASAGPDAKEIALWVLRR